MNTKDLEEIIEARGSEIKYLQSTVKKLQTEREYMKKAAKDLCWQCWSMRSGFNLDTPIEEFEKRDKHFEVWWKGKSLELNMPKRD